MLKGFGPVYKAHLKSMTQNSTKSHDRDVYVALSVGSIRCLRYARASRPDNFPSDSMPQIDARDYHPRESHTRGAIVIDWSPLNN